MSQLFKEFLNSFGQAIHPLCKRYAVIYCYKFRLLIELLIQLFHLCLIIHNYFKLSLTVLFTIAKFIILSLRGWFPFILTSLLSSYLIFWLNYRTMVFTFFGFHSLVLGWSDFTRHYSQSLGWFPFLSLLKWFTSGSN